MLVSWYVMPQPAVVLPEAVHLERLSAHMRKGPPPEEHIDWRLAQQPLEGAFNVDVEEGDASSDPEEGGDHKSR